MWQDRNRNETGTKSSSLSIFDVSVMNRCLAPRVELLCIVLHMLARYLLVHENESLDPSF